MGSKKPAHVAIYAGEGMGHLSPSLALARKLLAVDDQLHVTVFLVAIDDKTASSVQAQLFISLPDSHRVKTITLPAPDLSELDPKTRGESRMCIIIRESIPSLKSALCGLSLPPTVLIMVLFATDAFQVADELKIPKYLFCTTSAEVLAFMVHMPVLDKEIKGCYLEQPEAIKVPGCRPVQISDLLSPMLDRKSDSYDWFLYHARRFPLADGILVNTCEEIDHTALTALRNEKAFVQIGTPKIYPIGPLTRLPEKDKLAWLDSQPDGSVLFVSFGSIGKLSAEQIAELAAGLENSGQRFLWVTRPPAVGSKFSLSYLTYGKDKDDPSTYLPEGFLERTKTRGLVVPLWVPQTLVLSHPAVSAFLTHTGWNSASESLVYGVSMIVWPLFGEQRMNAAKLEEMGVAKRAGNSVGKAVVGRDEIEKVVRMVMEGEEGKKMKRRSKEMREKVIAATEEGGSSHKSMMEVLSEWKKM